MIELSTEKRERERDVLVATVHCREPVLTLTSDGPRDHSTGRRSSRRENLCGFFISLTFGMKAEVCSTG